MKVCMVVFGRYESDARVRKVSEALANRGDRVDVICIGPSSDEATPTNSSKKYNSFAETGSVNLYQINDTKYLGTNPLNYLAKLIAFLFKSAFLLSKLHIRKRYNVVHIHGVPNFEVFAAIIPKLLGAKIILDIHDLIPEFFARKFHIPPDHFIIKCLLLEERVCATLADHVITVTEPWRLKLINRSVPRDKCTVIMNVPDPAIFRPSNNSQEPKTDTFNILYYGTFSEITGTDLLVRAMKQIKDAIPNSKLTLLGGGPQHCRLETLSKEFRLTDSIDIRSGIPTPLLPKVIEEADICIDPKRDGVFAGETFSVKLMEYLAIRKPVVASRTAANSYYLNDATVEFFDPGNVDSLARAVINLYQHPKRRKQLVENSSVFLKQHNWPNYKKVYLELVDSLTSGRKNN
jgi:glycosyltransferase involved in cell wall biosynthesis